LERRLTSEDRPARPISRAQVYQTSLRVRYAETDQMGVVYHSNYVIWFEVGRVEMFRQLGFTYREMEEQDGIHVAVVEARCRFKAPARYDDLISVRTRLLNVRFAAAFRLRDCACNRRNLAGRRRDGAPGGGSGVQADPVAGEISGAFSASGGESRVRSRRKTNSLAMGPVVAH